VDTELRGQLVTTRATVYPRASAVEDHVQLVWLRDHWSPDDRDLGGDVLARASMRIRTHAGDLVWHRTVRDSYTPVFDWFARRHGGVSLPAGRYVARVTVTDEAGNRRHAQQDLGVSHTQLVEEVWTTTVAAAKAGRSDHYAGDPGCLGCYDICPPVASERFLEGLSFRPCGSPLTAGWAQVAHLGIDVPFAAAPVDSFRVTASGGPTTPGSGDVGYLDGITVGPGDASATAPWSTVELVTEPFLPDRDRPAHWSFRTAASTSYDVATFTVDYRHYVPVG